MIALLNANALHIPLADESVQTVITSPPYYGLRDYGVAGQIGLERTPAEYVDGLVRVFREVWRVLKDDGVLFLNLGDSYYSNPGNGRGGGSTLAGGKPHLSGAKRVVPYGTSDKAPEDYPSRDCLCGNLCDVCRTVYQSRKSHNDGLPVAMLTASLSASNRVHKELQSDHLPTSDSSIRVDRTSNATLDFLHSQLREGERLRAFLVSTLGLSSGQLLDVCYQRANRDECLLCARSLVDCVPGCADTMACTCGIELSEHQSCGRTSDTSLDLAYPYSTTKPLKPKDLIGIPWMVAFALRADGWYLRSDIIWAKPSCMPESVTDRPTKSHEYIFLLSKSASYYYNAEAIAEPSEELSGWAKQRANGINTWKYNDTDERILQTGQRIDSSTLGKIGTRNKRTVWTVATQPYSEAHFATFPPKLVEPMILAGSAKGDLVLDPFAGTATVGRVAIKHQRRFVGLELNPAYIELAQDRTINVQVAML